MNKKQLKKLRKQVQTLIELLNHLEVPLYKALPLFKEGDLVDICLPLSKPGWTEQGRVQQIYYEDGKTMYAVRTGYNKLLRVPEHDLKHADT